MSQCCVLCTLVRSACSRSAGESVASVNVLVVAEHASVAVLGGRSVLQCSARAAASEYCLLELRATQFHVLRQLRTILRQLYQLQSLIVALILSRLDYCNNVLSRLPACLLQRLQSV